MSFKDEFIALLKQRTVEHKINENIHRVTTPLLDRNNDFVEIYVIRDKDQLTITDDGYIVNDLLSSGLNFKNDTIRDRYLRNILSNHGVEMDSNNALYVKANPNNYSVKMYMLAQCMSKVSDLFVLNKPSVISLFNEDVKDFLIANEIRFIENPLFIGRSKLTTQYDFAIPRNRNIPERVIKVTSSISLNFARTTMFGWEDTKATRDKDSVLYLIFDDRNKKASDDINTALNSYDIKLVDWSNRNNFIDELSA